MLKIGIVGLPNVGKSTLFNAITNSEVQAANYPFSTIEPNVGVVEVKDERLDYLENLYQSKKKIYNQITFVDIAGLMQGASKGEGLGNQFLSNIREVDLIVQVVRLFESQDIVHIDGDVNPIRDIKTINLELILADIEQAQRWMKKNENRAMSEPKTKENLVTMKIVLDRLKNEQKLSDYEYNDKETKFLSQFNFLSFKQTIYLANVSEEEIINPLLNSHFKNFLSFVNENNSNYVVLSAQIEYEISKLEEDDQFEFLNSLGLYEPGLNSVSKIAFKTLGIATYFTSGLEEAHAWAFKIGIKAPQAAGIIHTDFETGFIKAEIFNISDIKKFGSEQLVRNAGKVRLEGKEYKMSDGDIVHFRFNN